jgi:hypothetical protein
MREIRQSGSMRGRRKRCGPAAARLCPTLRSPSSNYLLAPPRKRFFRPERSTSTSSSLSHLSALKEHEHRFVPGFAITKTA